MVQTVIRRVLLLLASTLLSACGGSGGNGPADMSAGTIGSSTTSTQSDQTTATAGATATTVSTTTTTTVTVLPQTSTTASVTTTTTAATSTATNSTTSSTAPGSSGLPPLAASRIELTPGAGGQILGTPAWTDAYGSGTGAAIGSANCDDWNRTRNYFGHAHLSIFRNGERLAIPQYVGWRNECIYDINSDNRNGVIDAVSATGYRIFLLGDFFRIWGQPLSWANVAGIIDLPIVIYIEDKGALSQYSGDPGAIELASYRSITIQIGSRLPEIPTYDWHNYGSGE